MKKVNPIEDYVELGASAAISIDNNELRNFSQLEDKLISFAQMHGAIVNEGEGPMVLLEINGAQRLLPLRGLFDAIEDFLYLKSMEHSMKPLA